MISFFCFRKKRDYVVTSEQKGEREREREKEIFKICMEGLSFIAANYFLRSLSIGFILLMMLCVCVL